MNLIYFILLLVPLIAIHEWGHFWVARLCGVKVLTYSIGFGPTLIDWTSKKSGVNYRLAALPLGGYVRMLDEREGDVPKEQQHMAFNRQNVWKRIAIVAAGPLINLILAVFIFFLLSLPASEQLNTRIGKVIENTPAAMADLRVGDKITAIDGKPTPTLDKLSYALLDRIGETGQVNVQFERNGQSLNANLPIENFVRDQSKSPMRTLGLMPYQPTIPAVIGQISDDGAAKRQGLQKGDKITAIDGKPIKEWSDAVEIIQASPEKLLQISILRNDQAMQLAVMPQGRKDSMGQQTGFIGAGVERVNYNIPNEYKMTVQYSPLEAMGVAVQKTWNLSTMILGSIYKMIQGLIGIDNLSGPITVAKVAGESAAMGWQTFFGFMALMSVSLGVLNLLPIPMLDGGHLLYYLVEAVRGRPVSEQIQIFGLKIGIALLGTMMLVALFNDFMRL
ncbi:MULTISPECIES: RIP metalloprotease RseP [unclassified Acinetobacter]|uniref:RIP metalloprotease RseP n=1 Tax=unclassified Acinetobacter TaxID=196816 RepID=UPI0035BB728C